MIFKSQTMENIFVAMTDVFEKWESAPAYDDELINPTVPVIVQLGDCGYEVQSIGGDPDCEGFVIMLKEKPVCKWQNMEFIKLQDKK